MRGPGAFILVLACILALTMLFSPTGTIGQEIEYTVFIKKIEQGQIGRIQIMQNEVKALKQDATQEQIERFPDQYWDFETYLPSIPVFMEDLEKALSVNHPDITNPQDAGITLDFVPKPEQSWLVSILPYLLTSILMIGFLWYMMNQQGQGGNKVMNFGRSRAKVNLDEKNKKTFEDVAGAEEEKEELQEVVDFLKNPKKFADLGARIPKGVLLVGPPGTGKTLLAKAVAGEAGVPFYSISGSDFVEMFVGVGASRVRDLFETAKKNSPCMIFIDEIDAVGRHRGAGMGGGHDEREQTLNQLLVEMDGFAPNEGIIIIAATNRPDILDPALLRPGRFDRQITVNYPDIKGREEILAVHSKGKPIAEDVDLHTVAKRTPYFTGADLENVMNEAAILTARKGKTEIHMQEILEAINRVTVGPEKKSSVVTEKDKKLVAYHESGHALVAHLLPNCNPVHEVSIIPRGQAGGYTMTLPTEETKYVTKSYLLDDIAMALGGRAAEEIMLGEISTGAYSDLKHATSNARRMVREYGMSEKIGSVFYGDSDQEVFLGRDFGHQKSYSEKVAADIDEEVRSILDNAMETALSLIRTHKDKMEELAEQLIVKEKLTAEEFEQIMEGKLPEAAGADEQNHKAALTEGTAQEEEKQDQTPEA
ncbi:MAG: ATP-dependent zinc metalloprotease FtsH [Clostridiales bacterium]|nr:ATP-dependent zinc metalloprotease FtsH [Clostridiales bacterium]